MWHIVKYMLVGTVCLTTANIMAAQKASINKQIVNHFVKCDRPFFGILSKQKNYLKRNLDVEMSAIQKGLATFSTPDMITHNGKAGIGYTQLFNHPMKYKSLSFISYDTLSYRIVNDDYFFWGFKIKAESLADIMKQLSMVKWIKLDEQEYVSRPKVMKASSNVIKWKRNPYIAVGIAPEEGTAEKFLLLSQGKGYFTLYCSLQGTMNDRLLKHYRPDIIKVQ